MLHDWRRHLIGGGHHWGPSFGTFKVIIATSFFILPSFNLSPLGLAITSAAISVSAAALETSGSGEEEAVHSSGTLNGQGIGDTLDKEEAKRDMPSPRKSRAATVMRPENEATEPNSEEPFRPPVFRFYLPPIQMVHWGDPQLRPHTDWFDLFFDLIFVAIALQLGTFLSYSVNRIGALYFVSMVLTILGSWATKHNYEARIDTEDLFHKLVDVLEALLVAGQGLHIAGSNNLSPLEDMQDLNTGFALGFSTLTFLLRLIYALLWLEVYWYGEEVPDEARSGFGATIFDKALPVIVHAAAVFFSCPSLFGDVINANVACALWFFASMIEQFGGIFFLVIVVPHWPKEKRIPIHVAYSAHRHGELTMLLMGEAILSLIVGVSLKPLPSFYLVFAFGFIAAMSLKFVHYSTQPIQANAHALRQNVSQAIIWVRGQYLHSMALIAFGVSLKILLKYHDYEGCSDESDIDSSNSGGSSYSSSYSSSHRLLDSASFYGASSYSAYSAYDSGASGSKCLKHDYTVLFSVSLGCSYVLDLITGAQHKGQAIFPPISEWRSHFTGPRGISFASPRVCVAFAIFLLP
jgi:low temperature requirement protein LtrA